MLIGRNSQGKFVDIDNVSPTDEIRCPECDELLIQKRGNIRVHHFAHKQNSNCSNTGMSWQHLAIQKYLKRFFERGCVADSQLEKRITTSDGKTIIADYFLEAWIQGWYMKICFEVVENNTNYAHYCQKKDEYFWSDMNVVWVFDENKLEKKIDGTWIKLNAMQEKIMRDTGQICSISSEHLDGIYIRKLYFPKGQWRKQTCKIYSTTFVNSVHDLIIIPLYSGAILMKDGDEIMKNMNDDYYNVWWTNEEDGSDDWDECDGYYNTYIRKEINGIVAEDYIYGEKLKVFDESEEKIASIPKNKLYEGLQRGDTVKIISRGNGRVDVEKNGSPITPPEKSGNYKELLTQFSSINDNKQLKPDAVMVDDSECDLTKMDCPVDSSRGEDLRADVMSDVVDFITTQYEEKKKEVEQYKKLLEILGGYSDD